MFINDWILGLSFIPRLASIALNWGDWLAWLCKAEKVDTSWFSIDPIWPNAERIPAEKLDPVPKAWPDAPVWVGIVWPSFTKMEY